jgi:hypothetical protein
MSLPWRAWLDRREKPGGQPDTSVGQVPRNPFDSGQDTARQQSPERRPDVHLQHSIAGEACDDPGLGQAEQAW